MNRFDDIFEFDADTLFPVCGINLTVSVAIGAEPRNLRPCVYAFTNHCFYNVSSRKAVNRTQRTIFLWIAQFVGLTPPATSHPSCFYFENFTGTGVSAFQSCQHRQRLANALWVGSIVCGCIWFVRLFQLKQAILSISASRTTSSQLHSPQPHL